MTCLVGPRQYRNFSSLPCAQLRRIQGTMQCVDEGLKGRMRGGRGGTREVENAETDTCIGCPTRSPTTTAERRTSLVGVIGSTTPALPTDIGPCTPQGHISPCKLQGSLGIARGVS